MSTEADKPARTSRGWQIATAVAALLLLWFAIDNSSSVNVHFWVRTVSAPVILVIVVSALLGALIVALWRRSRRPR
jgi:uncharacterized integral membrane protein